MAYSGRGRSCGRAIPPHVAVLVTGLVIVVIAVGLLTWSSVQASHDKALRTSRVYGAHVESVLQNLFHKTDILEAIVVTQNGELSDETFGNIAKSLDGDKGIRSIQCLPGGDVLFVYPLEGNEGVLGTNVFDDPLRRVDAQLAVDTKEITLSGPYALTQGGFGLVARNPIFLADEHGGETFWGFAVIILDMPDALEPVGLAELVAEGYRYELLASSEEGDRLTVDASDVAPSADAEEYSISVPNHTWTLRLSPADGWVSVGSMLLVGLLGLAVSVLLAVVVRQDQKGRALLSTQATTDELTGMRNRRWFADMIEGRCASPHAQPFWLFYLDLNGFKKVNDTRGHRCGDLLLVQVARRFEEACGSDCELARLGGDEFVVALSKSDRVHAQRMKDRLQGVLDRPIRIDDDDVKISVSIGMSAYPQDGWTYDELLHAADKRMYEAKQERKTD